ncbi:inositol-phosphate transport system permease protein [Desulfohalotomaculum tongense]|uniref:carbohydrate ABC transporter permease n=1 Tax=Desulforadius tongensis TaxID=1216062 RepID=UPI00195DA9CD|nr:carbohydrate ABC transporter permease [Desulforadius tongensis]MBM7854842.1 inositol-phosphate transport system permease protein [Desulforadius tongensis]
MGLIQKDRLETIIPRVMVYVVLVIVSLPLFIAYGWLFLNSLSDGAFGGIIPNKFTLQNWRFLWSEVRIGTTAFQSIWPITWNTFVLAAGITVIEILIAALSGFALSRMKFAGKDLIMKLTIFLHAFPGVALLIALYIVLQKLNLLDKLLGVILVKVALELPMATWMMKGFFDGIPWDIEWASYIDGCNRLQTWWKIIIPQLKPGIAAVAIFAFMSGWSEFIYAFTFIYSPENYTLAIYLKNLIGDFKMLDYGLLCAAGLFYMIPTILFFIFSQKSLMKVSFGGVKGPN